MPYGFEPQPASQAAAEFSQQALYVGPWSAQPLADALGPANMLIYAAEDNLRSVAVLIEDGNSLYGPTILLRAALENVARAWRILSAHGIEERLCRGWNFLLYSDYERRALEQEMRIADSRTPRIKQVLNSAGAAGLPVGPSKKGSPKWLGSGWQNATGICRLMLADGSRQPQDELGAVLYRLLSATPHGASHGILRNMQVVAGGERSSLGFLSVNPGNHTETALLAACVGIAYLEAATKQMEYFGWGGTGWDAWMKEFGKHLRQV